MTEEKPVKTAWVKAMDYLARRDHSELELVEKLQKHYTMEEIESTIAEMKQKGWILPPEELSQKVTGELHSKLKGYLFICHFLRQKGLPPVERDQDIELEKAKEIIASKAKDPHDIKKVASLLKNRGFDTETVGRMVNEIRRNSSGFY